MCCFFKIIALFILWVFSIVVAVEVVVRKIPLHDAYKYAYEYIKPMIDVCWNCLFQSCSGIAHFVSNCAWQLLIVAFVYLLVRKDKLDPTIDAMLDFVRRSHLGNRDIQPGDSENKNDETNKNENLELSPNKNEAISEMRKGRMFEFFVLKKLQDEFKQVIRRDVRIFGSNITFDGVIEDGYQLTAIEVKYKVDTCVLREWFASVNHFYETLPNRDKKRFSVLLCIGKQNEAIYKELIDLKTKFVVPISYKFFQMDN